MSTERRTQQPIADEAGGALVVDKPAGWTSHDVVARCRRLLGTRRVGHTGTLDPFATGVLVVLTGRATRLAQFLAGAEKEYEAVIRFGYRTDTGDPTGAPLDPVSPANVSDLMVRDESEFESALASLRGNQEQTPPMYSAKKIAGRKLYELAREGEEVARAPVRIFVREFAALPSADGTLLTENPDGTSDLRARVVCSAGTYIRTLAEDLGVRLGAPAHLAALRRTRAGRFTLRDAATLDELQQARDADDLAALRRRIVTPADLLAEMPAARLTPELLARARHGAAVAVEFGADVPEGAHVRLLAPAGRLVAVGIYDAASRAARPRVMLDAGEGEIDVADAESNR